MMVDAVERKQRRAGANDKRRMAGGPAERPSHPPNARIIKPTTQSQSMEAYYRIPSRKIRKTRRHSRRPPACPHPHAGAPTPFHSPSLRPPRLPGSRRPRVLLVESNPSPFPLPHQSACVPASVSPHSHKNVRRERTVQIRTAPCDLMMASRTAYQSNPACPSSFLGPLTDSLTDARTNPPRGLSLLLVPHTPCATQCAFMFSCSQLPSSACSILASVWVSSAACVHPPNPHHADPSPEL